MARRRSIPVVTGIAIALGVMTAGPALAAPSDQDATWMKAAHQYNLTEIAAGTAAQSRASSATVKSLGRMFIADHTAGDAKLRAAAAKLGVALPKAPNTMQRAQLAEGSQLSGSAFDAFFLTSQTMGHTKALADTRTEAASGDDATAVTLAKANAPVIAKHLNELQAARSGSSPMAVPGGDGGQAATGGVGEGAALAGLGALLVGASAVAVKRQRQQA